MSPGGTLFVGNRNEDKVYAIKDTDGDYKADKKWVIASGLNMPNGVAFKDGNLYVAEVSRPRYANPQFPRKFRRFPANTALLLPPKGNPNPR